jgi:hypothetical protein
MIGFCCVSVSGKVIHVEYGLYFFKMASEMTSYTLEVGIGIMQT